ncbi:MAG: molybdopterin synthase sulfur carrier subunit [Deltaproteobacteria bacterium RIFCSPLOWO2_12_FULL_43_16]|nr:MAG: molybdopterin synthase sulfur carrier subunit [Deltaproteobacteria bacterium GWA2_43_19]OGQ13027.1 MAG: molybdopterin synthase sulfur carrier subunit [Deltaproteobacteria bacterium RIFCSPHIGHO2_02_FULL_43_33]OGQ57329.1 MAG: molybdopterin synthase sulfur carrier subunit [Deltaproteobacteria bacterium RIFCSPLOWO2_12_FULL_43_16]HBR17203.1 molybdopterin synthase sulfur carrier subunit [Deltaproteobacteria bacterium]
MAVKVRIPTPLRKLTNGQDEISAEGKTVKDVIEDIERHYPGLKERICEGEGKLRRFVNIYVNDEDIRFKNNIDTALKADDEVSIIPAIAGGLL